MKRYFLFLAIMFWGIVCHLTLKGQNSSCARIHFDYDDSGNRIKRSLIVEDPCTWFSGGDNGSNARMASAMGENNEIAAEDKSGERVLQEDITIAIIPNPTEGKAEVVCKGASISLTVLTDGKGNVISRNYNTAAHSLDLRGYSAGLYKIIIYTETGKRITTTIVKI